MNTTIKYGYLLLMLLVFTQCRKDEITPINGESSLLDDDNVSFVIRIIDAKSNGIAKATMTLANSSQSYTSDDNGIIVLKNITTPRTGLLAKVNATYYHEQIKLLSGNTSSNNVMVIQMVDNRNFTPILTGTESKIIGEGKIKLPESLLLDNGSEYQGPVSVVNNYFNPDDPHFLLAAPGNMLAVDSSNNYKILGSLGMYRIELTTPSGQSLHIKTGDKAQLSFPIKESHQGKTGSKVPLWSMDESTGLWKREGDARVENNYMVADVGHFSFWNCDLDFTYKDFCFQVKNANGTLLPGIELKLFVQDVFQFRDGFTNSAGEYCSPVPLSATIRVDAYLGDVFLQSFNVGPYTSETSEILTLTNNVVIVSGKALNCAMETLSEGYGISADASGGHISNLFFIKSNGAFSFAAIPVNQILTLVNLLDEKFKIIQINENDLTADLMLGDIVLCEETGVSKISGHVLLDTNGDNIGDSPLSGAKVLISTYDTKDTIYQLITDASGYYEKAVPPVRYIIDVPDFLDKKVIGSGDLSIDGANENDAGVITSNKRIICRLDFLEHDADNDFVLIETGYGDVSGNVKVDIDGDGVGDKVAQGVRILLANGLNPNSEGTDNNGNFTFMHQESSSGRLEISDKVGWIPASDYDHTPDPDGDDSASGGNFQIPVFLQANEIDANNDFVLTLQKSKIVCRVLFDSDNDGIGDTPIINQRVELYTRNEFGVPQTPGFGGGPTDLNGYITFSNIEPGEYVLYFIGTGEYIAVSNTDLIPDNNPSNTSGQVIFIPVNITNKEYDDGNTYVVKKN